MRVPTLQSAQRQFDGIEQRLARQSQLNEQLSTGLRVNRPGDDPLAASQAERARSRLSMLAQDQRAGSLAQSLLSNAEGALGRGIAALQSARELMVATANGSYSASERQALALQLRSLRDEMLSVARAEDGAGGTVFGLTPGGGGAGGAGGLPAFGPVQGIGEGGRYAATVDGNAAFMALPQGNGVFLAASAAGNTGTGWVDAGQVSDPTALTGHRYSIDIGGTAGALTWSVRDLDAGTTAVAAQPLSLPATLAVDGQQVRVDGQPQPGDAFTLSPAATQGVFGLLDQTVAWLEDATLPAPARHEQQARSLAGIDRALEGLSLLRSGVGSALQRVDDAAQDNAAQSLAATTRRSQLQDADLAQSVSELQSNQAGLEAALKAYASLGQASLMKLLP